MDLRVFRYRGFTGSFLMSMVIGAGVFASTYITPLYFQQVLGESAASAGLMLMPAGLAMAFTFPVAGHLTDRFPETRIMAAGLVLFIFNMALMAGANLGTSAVWLVWWTLLGRVGLGLMMPPSSTGALGLLPPGLIPQGSGIFNFGRQIGGALGVTLCALCIQFFSESFAQDRPAASAAQAFESGFDMAFLLLLAIFVVALLPLRSMQQGMRHLGEQHMNKTGNDKPDILVIGAGAIGSFYGAILKRAGCSVSVVLRSDYDAVKANGFRFTSPLGELSWTPDQVYQPGDTPDDIQIMCCCASRSCQVWTGLNWCARGLGSTRVWC